MSQQPALPLSATRRCGDFVFVSGQVGTDPSTGKVVDGGIAAQTRQVLENLRRALAGEGLDLGDVVKSTIFVTEPGDFATVNEIYREYFSEPFPARSTVAVQLVAPGLQVEIEAVACAAGSETSNG